MKRAEALQNKRESKFSDLQVLHWNVRDKTVQDVLDTLQEVIHPPDLLLLQEVGGLGKGAPDAVLSFDLWSGNDKYSCFHIDSADGFRQICIVIRHPFAEHVQSTCALSVGLGVSLKPKRGKPIHAVTCHFPHSKRPDAKTVWENGTRELSSFLQTPHPDDFVIFSVDLNQDYTLHYDTFSEMPHFRTVIVQNDLRMQDYQGDSWFARGHSSKIDFSFFRGLGVEGSIQNRDDLRLGLPSDHNALLLTYSAKVPFLRPHYRRTLCGKWNIDTRRAMNACLESAGKPFTLSTLAGIRQACAIKPPSLRYKDPQAVSDLIDLRKQASDPVERARLAGCIHEARKTAKEEHKTMLLHAAQQGDRRVISFLKRSSAASATDAGFLQRAGGSEQAVQDVKLHYHAKYTATDPTPFSPLIEELYSKHGCAPVNPITRGEVLRHLGKLDTQTCTGENGVPYTLLKEITRSDLGEEFCQFLTGILRSGKVPSEWKVGRISFIPKIKLPSNAADLRPICLTNTVAKLFGRILIHRMRAFLPPCNSLQLGCQPGRQAMDGVNTVKAAIAISNRVCGPLCFAKLDIKAAFDSLSHRAAG